MADLDSKPQVQEVLRRHVGHMNYAFPSAPWLTARWRSVAPRAQVFLWLQDVSLGRPRYRSDTPQKRRHARRGFRRGPPSRSPHARGGRAPVGGSGRKGGFREDRRWGVSPSARGPA
jgi:hypothetical protein